MSIAEYTCKIALDDYFTYLWECEDIEVIIGTVDDYDDPAEYEKRRKALAMEDGSPTNYAYAHDLVSQAARDGLDGGTDWHALLDTALRDLRAELTRDDYWVRDVFDLSADCGGYHDADALIDHFDLDSGSTFWKLEHTWDKTRYRLLVWNDDDTDEFEHHETYELEYGLIINSTDERRWHKPPEPEKPVILNVAQTTLFTRMLAIPANMC